ncbi:MAG: serine--tRNA ligase [Hyphomicrobiales bacterium]|nr:serine--tRNA ligase [Hyphomicrobiales bacterium]
MFDVKWIRDHPEAFDAGLAKRGLEPLSVEALKLDDARRAHIVRLQEMQEKRNAASKEIGQAKAKGDEARAKSLIDEVAKLKADIQAGEEEERRLTAALDDFLATVPNLPLDEVPVGEDESANEVVHVEGSAPKFDFEPKQHFDIGEALGLMDFETAAKISGARFVILKGALARMERAIAAFMLDLHTTEFGYTEILPPALVRDNALFGTGQLPKFADDLFPTTSRPRTYEDTVQDALKLRKLIGDRTTDDEFAAFLFGKLEPQRKEELDEIVEGTDLFNDERVPLWLIPTAEVPLTNLVREQIVPEVDLPMRLTAWTPCFRAEAGAAGKDTRGMIRQHQFSKVELVSIVAPDQSLDELERMRGCAEEVLKRLGLHYRTVVLSTGDMGFAAQKTYDIEVWLPGQNAYREISSCSLCGDFQARRMQARYRPADGGPVHHVHTLNGSGLAVGRTLIAILENYQEADGGVIVPEALRPYMGDLERIEATARER